MPHRTVEQLSSYVLSMGKKQGTNKALVFIPFIDPLPQDV